MRVRLTYLFLFIATLLSAWNADAQKAKNKSFASDNFTNSWLIGASIGPDFFYGDVNKSKILPGKNISVSGGVFATRQITHVIGFKGQILISGLTGKKEVVTDSANSSLTSFSGFMMDITLNTTINFSNMVSAYKPSRRFFVYGTFGFGWAAWKTKMNETVNGNEVLTVPQTWGSAVVFPIGLGAYYSVTSKINVGAEWTFRIVMSDMVDQMKGGFRYDIYDYLALGITFNLGPSGKKAMKVNDYPYAPVTKTITPAPAYDPIPIVETSGNPVVTSEPGDYVYVVQIFAFAKYKHSAESIRKKYHIAQPVKRELVDGVYRYTIGNYKDIEYARELKKEMIRKGIHDTFIIAYKDGIRHHTVTE